MPVPEVRKKFSYAEETKSVDVNKCFTEGCGKPLGPDAITVLCGGEPCGGICDTCIAANAGIRMLLRKNRAGNFTLEEVTTLSKLV